MRVEVQPLSHWVKADISSRPSCLYWPQASREQPGRSLWRKTDTVQEEDRNEAGRGGFGSVVWSGASIGNCMDSEVNVCFWMAVDFPELT